MRRKTIQEIVTTQSINPSAMCTLMVRHWAIEKADANSIPGFVYAKAAVRRLAENFAIATAERNAFDRIPSPDDNGLRRAFWMQFAGAGSNLLKSLACFRSLAARRGSSGW